MASDLGVANQSAAAAAEVLKQRGLAPLGIGKGKDIGKGKGEDTGKGASRGKGKGKDANVDDDSDQTGPRPETMSNDDQRVTMSLTTYYVGSHEEAAALQESENMQGVQIHVLSNHHGAQDEALMQPALMQYEVPRSMEDVEVNGLTRHSLSNADWTELRQHWIRNYASVEEEQMYGLMSRAMRLSLNLHASESQSSHMMRDDHPADTADVRRGHEPSGVREVSLGCSSEPSIEDPSESRQRWPSDPTDPSERALFGPESGLSE